MRRLAFASSLALAVALIASVAPGCGLPLSGSAADAGSDNASCPGIDLSVSLANCGACGHACDTRAHMPAQCRAGQCVYTCETGYFDCDGNASTGCESLVSNDPQNCGACGNGCEEATCANSRCQPVAIASGRVDPAGIAVDADRVYFTEASGVVSSVAKNGQDLRLVANGARPNQIVVDGANVYFTDLGPPPSGPGAVIRAPKDGSAPVGVPIATVQGEPAAIVVQGTTVYWADTSGGAVRRQSITPTAGQVPSDIAVGQAQPFGVTVDDTYLYWTSTGSGTITRWKLDASAAPQIFVTGQPTGADGPLATTIGGNYLLWTTQGAHGTVSRAARDGSSSVIVLASDQPNTRFAAADATNVYYTRTSSSSGRAGLGDAPTGGVYVRSLDRLDVPPAPLVVGQDAPLAIAQDDRHLYWIDLGPVLGQGHVWKMLK